MSPDDTLAFWIAAAGRGELRREAVPAPGALEASVRTLYSGVSRGTESIVFGGHVPEGEYGRMRAPFQAGQFPFPVKYGYASVGEVTHGPPGLAGKSVFCLYPHQQRYVVPCDALHVVPDSVPPARAVLAANLETALNGLWDCGASPGDRITVIGAGSVGCLLAWLASRMPGCDVELVDVNPRRATVAAGLGVRFALPGDARPEADVVLHASGSAAGLSLALRVAGFEATIAELSWYADRPVTLALGEAFHARRLTLKSSQVGAIGQSHRARWSLRRRLQLALSLLADPALDLLINSEGRFEDLPRTLEHLARSPGDVIMHRVRYGPDDAGSG
ncbi:MAG TPA: zinc-binding alcohol dehydrogenase [Steroidobacteraceae bacterium]|nr:zinc-binding alcohol dehydrogenase [Steroidobacteraceae bacterium]